MVDPTKVQKITLKSIFVNCGSIVFGTLIIGTVLAPIFRWHLFLVGCILFLSFITLALMIEK